MRAIEAINETDELESNRFDGDLKQKWLADLDGKIFRELIEKHDDPASAERYEAANYDDPDVELLIGEPYARDVYVSYLRARIAQANAESERYNMFAAAYNAEFTQFAADYNRKTPMLRQRGWRY